MKQPTKQFALCVDNVDYEVSLTLGKVYPILPDARAAKDDFIRIIDESGEDYVFTANRFHVVHLPHAVGQVLLAASRP